CFKSGYLNKLVNGGLIPVSSSSFISALIAISEWPPNSKKLLFNEIVFTCSNSDQTFAINFSLSVCGKAADVISELIFGGLGRLFLSTFPLVVVGNLSIQTI